MELVFQSIFLYFLSLVYVSGGRLFPAWIGNGSGWGPASTLDLHSLSDRCFDQRDRSQENGLLSVSCHNSLFFKEILLYSKDTRGLHPLELLVLLKASVQFCYKSTYRGI